MRASIFLAVAVSCQLGLLVFGEGAAEGSASWHIDRRPTSALAKVASTGRDGEAAVAFDMKASPLPPPEITVLPGIPVLESPEPNRFPVRGIYATAYSAGSPARFEEILSFIRQTEVNAIVIDVKDDTGDLSYPSNIPLAIKIQAGKAKFSPEKIIPVLRREGIYPIARIVAFKDPCLAAKRPDLAVRSKSGGVWRDYRGQSWVDPHSREVWQYAVDVAKEAAAKGFKEIQFDYVRFTSDGNLSDCVYPFADGRKKADVIRDFLVFARKELKPLGVDIAADIFGLTCSATDDLGIGQRIEQIACAVDVVSPMVYPSHYYQGTYGIRDPDLAPYETVLTSLRAATTRLTGLGVRLRPWLQDFSLRNKYGRPQLMAQIKAVYDAGLTEWIFWNPSNRYDTAKYNPE